MSGYEADVLTWSERQAALPAAGRGRGVRVGTLPVRNRLREVTTLVTDAVSDFRARGHTRALATDMAAKALGITSQRAKALLYGQALKASEDERRGIRAAFLLHLDDEMDEIQRRIEVLKAKRKKVELELLKEAPAMGQ